MYPSANEATSRVLDGSTAHLAKISLRGPHISAMLTYRRGGWRKRIFAVSIHARPHDADIFLVTQFLLERLTSSPHRMLENA